MYNPNTHREWVNVFNGEIYGNTERNTKTIVLMKK